MSRPLHLILVISAGIACAQVQVPTTPAGQTFRAWLDAFNSSDHARMESFLRTHTVQRDDAEAMMKAREDIGRLELLSVDKVIRAGDPSPIDLNTKSLPTDRQKWTHIQFRAKQTEPQGQ